MVALFGLAVLAIVAAVDVLVLVVFGMTRSRSDGSIAFPVGPMLLVSLLVVGLITLASMFRSASLRSGGGAVARGLHATPVPPDTANPAWRRLRNVVEEVAIASGVPVPEIFVLEKEPGINAFAAGYSPVDAAVCVTQGCLEVLNRDELQGVVAHEFSHVLNGDMRLNIRLMGILFGIIALSVIGRQLLNAAFWTGGSIGGGRGRRDNGNALWALGLGLLVIGGIGVFFARLIKASVARSRESLADASAVQFTRQTGGIASALKKIGALEYGSQLTQVHGEEVSHMLFGEGHDWSALFATHPPLDERIRALEPGFDAREFRHIAEQWTSLSRAPSADDPRASATGMLPRGLLQSTGAPLPGAAAVAASLAVTSVLPHPQARTAVDPAAVAAKVGQSEPAGFAHAARITAALPEPLVAAAHSPQQALPLLLALALASEPATRSQQMRLVLQRFPNSVVEAADALGPAVAALHPILRLPLAAMAFPALRRRPRPELAALVQALAEIVHADGTIAVEEYCLAALVRVQVVDALDPAGGFVAGSSKLVDCRESVILVLTVLAAFGHDDTVGATRAFQLGLSAVLPDATDRYEPPTDWQDRLDQALVRLDRLAPAGKEILVQAMTQVVREDGQLRVAEVELLRVICAALHCPLPALLDDDATPGPGGS